MVNWLIVIFWLLQSEDIMTDFQDWIGKTEFHKDAVALSSLQRFKSTLGYDCDDSIVPDGFHWCLGLPTENTQTLGVDGHPPLGGFMPSLSFPRRMWAGSDVEFLSPLKPAMEIERKSTIASIESKSGRSGDLLFVKLDHETFSGSTCLIRERQTIVYRDHPNEKSPLPKEDMNADIGEWDFTESVVPTTPLLFRYSSITFNSHRIHYDQNYAVNVELYPELVVHGPLTASLLLRLCANRFGHNKLKTFKYRAKSPLYQGQSLRLAVRSSGEDVELCAFGGDGRVAMQATATLNN